MILCLAILVQCRLVTDRQTDGWTHDNSKYGTVLTQRQTGKNEQSIQYLYKNFITSNNFRTFCDNQTNFCS